jgi:phage terminase large subunit-like protein
MTTKAPQTRNISTDRATAYAQAVIAGEIVAGPHVRNACRRHLNDLEEGHRRGLTFDVAAADRAFGFFEEVLRLSEGQFEGQPFELHPSQAFIVGSIFGWKIRSGRRRFRRAYIEQGKGNGKSPLAGGIGLIGLCGDGESGSQVYAAASRKDQADILFRDAVKMVRAAPALAKRLTFSGGPGREYNIAHLKTASFFRPVSRDTGKTGSGPRPHFVLADEIHEIADRSIIEMLERGFKFRREPLLLMITNSGFDRNSVCWEEHAHAVKVAAGNHDALTDPTFLGSPLDDSTFSFVCSLDDGDDPLNDPSCWVKANPLLGVTIERDYLAGVVAQAKSIPAKLNNILRLHFCVWTDADSAWLPRSAVEPCVCEFEPAEGVSTSAGVDLSATQDMTAVGYCQITGERDGKPLFDIWADIWTPADTLSARALKDNAPYDEWARLGYLKTTPGKIVDFRFVAAQLAGSSARFAISDVGYDRYAYRRFENECDEIGLSVRHVEHPQGGKKKGKPLVDGVEGLWMPGSVKLLEEAIIEGRVRIRRNPALISAIMSATTEHDPWGNYWLAKRKSVNRIDAVIAVCMAVGVAMGAKQEPALELQVFM